MTSSFVINFAEKGKIFAKTPYDWHHTPGWHPGQLIYSPYRAYFNNRTQVNNKNTSLRGDTTKQSVLLCYHNFTSFSYKSSQFGFNSSINAIFCALLPPFILFSSAIASSIIVNKLVHFILTCKRIRISLVLMLIYSRLQVWCHTCIQNRMTATGQNINTSSSLHVQLMFTYTLFARLLRSSQWRQNSYNALLKNRSQFPLKILSISSSLYPLLDKR